MKRRTGKVICWSVLLGFLAAFGAGFLIPAAQAQVQPAEATNAQDEYVHIGASTPDDEGVLTIFRSNNKREIRRYFSEVIELKHAAGFEVFPHVLRAVNLEAGAARVLKYKDPVTGKDRHFVQVITTEKQMPSVLQTIRDLDLPGVTSSEGDLKYSVRLRHRRASEVADILGRTSLSGEGKVFADNVSNTVYFMDSLSDGERNIAYIDFYDVPPPQVEFDIQVIELSENNGRKLGLDWNAWKRAISGRISVASVWVEGASITSQMDSLLTLNATVLADFLNYTAQTGTGKVLYRARVTAGNNLEAVIRDERPVATFDEKKEGRTITAPTEGFEIRITPTIGTDLVTANIQVTANMLDALDKLQEPIVSTRRIETVATLENEKGFLLGSARRQVSDGYRSGIPGLKSVPGLKYLFSVEAKRNVESRVFIIATPVFKNQVSYAARTITSARPEVSPPVKKQPVEMPEEAARASREGK